MPRTRSLAWSELKIGVMAVAALALTAVLVIAVGGASGFAWQRYEIKTNFANVQGLKAGAIVRIAGVEVGKVTKVRLAGAGVDVYLSIKEENQSRVTTDSLASIGAMSLLGEPLIDVSAATTGTPLKNGDTIKSKKPASQLSDVAETANEGIVEATALLKDIREGKGSVGKLFAEDKLYNDLNAFVESANAVTASINKGKGTIGRLTNDPRAYNELQAALTNLQEMTARINAGELLNEKELYDKLNSTVNRLDELTRNLNDGKGTAGQLLHDTKLYDTMNTAANEIKELVAAIKKDPKKYLNVRVSIF
jgi:phospholipid/cholesterol/gamma-HCH transport system substrate-binding protein